MTRYAVLSALTRERLTSATFLTYREALAYAEGSGFTSYVVRHVVAPHRFVIGTTTKLCYICTKPRHDPQHDEVAE